MKIFLLFRNPFPYGMAPSQHVTCEAMGLKSARADIEVDVFVPPLDKTNDDGLPAKGEFNGIPYNYIHGKFRPKRMVSQIINRLWNTLKTFFWGLKIFKKGDIVYCYGGDNLSLFLFTWAAHLKKAKLVVELVEIPFWGDELLFRMRRWISTTFLFSHFDGFVCISHSLMDFARKYGHENVPIFLLPILVEENKIQSSQRSRYAVPYIIHTGTMTEQKDGISHILKGFAEFKKTDNTGCRLVFTGPDANKRTSNYLSIINELGIAESVDLLGMIATREELLGLQYHATMSIVYKVENTQTKYCFATKIGEILMAGIPLITTKIGEHMFYLQNQVSAYIVSPGNEIELAKTIDYVLSHPDDMKKVGLKGKEVAKTDFNPILQGIKLYEYFLNLK